MSEKRKTSEVTGKFLSKVLDFVINHNFENVSNCVTPCPGAQYYFEQATTQIGIMPF